MSKQSDPAVPWMHRYTMNKHSGLPPRVKGLRVSDRTRLQEIVAVKTKYTGEKTLVNGVFMQKQVRKA